MSYAVIKVGGKQYRVREGERLLVDRLKTDPGKTFTPAVLLADGDLDSKAVVTARVVDHVLGDKIRIGKYRASLSQIEIESIGAAKAAPAKKTEAAEEEKPKARAAPRATAAKKPAAEKKPAAKKPAAKKEEK